MFCFFTIVPRYFSPLLFSSKGEEENVSNLESNFQKVSGNTGDPSSLFYD